MRTPLAVFAAAIVALSFAAAGTAGGGWFEIHAAGSYYTYDRAEFIPPSTYTNGCGWSPNNAATLVFSSGGRNYTTRSGDLCLPRDESLANWRWGTVSVDSDHGRFVLDPYAYQGPKQRQTVAWRLYQNGVVQAHGQFLVIHFLENTGQIIWQGTDAFVNECIDKIRSVYSKGGRLYCTTGSVRNRSRIVNLGWR